jgi:methylated-DNA-protein-cysteine methyltransferase-like protein
MNTYEEIYAVARQIPRAKVATYGQIAHLIGRSHHARLVGYALHQVDFQDSEVPWHRVINAKGEVSYSVLRRGSDYLQRTLLEMEGIEFTSEGRISLARYQWQPPTLNLT